VNIIYIVSESTRQQIQLSYGIVSMYRDCCGMSERVAHQRLKGSIRVTDNEQRMCV